MDGIVTIPLPADPVLDAVRCVEQDHRRVVLTRDGAAVAAVVSVEDLLLLEDLEQAEDTHWGREADKAIARWEAEGRPAGTSHAAMLARYGIAPDAV
jgi:PHD/YefM family antitoxin component YafN of YafNO toxin-antitoxin module